MTRTYVESSMFSSVGYDCDTAILEVEYKKSGQIWQYFDVPQYVHEEMMAGTSIGKYFNANILKQYSEGRV